MRMRVSRFGVPLAALLLSTGVVRGAARAQAVTASPTSTPEPGPLQTPFAFYQSYLGAVEAMKSPKDVDRFFPAGSTDADRKLDREAVERLHRAGITGVRVLEQTPEQTGYLLEMEGVRKSDAQRVRGWARIVRERGTWKLSRDDWTTARPPAPPRIPGSISVWGGAVGELTVEGETFRLAHSRAVEIPDGPDRTKPGYRVIVSDVPWNAKERDPVSGAKEGALHAIELTIGANGRLKETRILHRAFENGALRPADAGVFGGEKIGPESVAGRAYIEAPLTVGGHTYYYAVTFRAPVDWEAKP